MNVVPRRTQAVLWSDGIHLVRRASSIDPHPMRWRVGNHKTTASTYTRHVPSLEEGIKRAEQATKTWLKKHPEDQKLIKLKLPRSMMPKASSKEENEPEGFSTYHFDCIIANPYAQVWQCISMPGEKRPVGRPTKDGRAPKQTAFRHYLGECAVMVGREVVRHPDGKVKVFHNWAMADEYALWLYENAPEEESFPWKEGDKLMMETLNIKVVFDPEVNGAKRPFSLYLFKHNRPIYEDKTRPLMFANSARPTTKVETNAQKHLDNLKWRREKQAQDRQPTFSEKPLTFRSLPEAIDEAYRREKMIRGEEV